MNTEKSLFCGINRQEATADQVVKEKHLPTFILPPKITAGKAFDLKIDCGGEGKHPNEHGHFIQWVEVYAGEVFLTRAEFTPVMTNPVITLPVVLYHPGATQLRALSRCNLHGLWESTITVTPEKE